jgi:hypothetical protein
MPKIELEIRTSILEGHRMRRRACVVLPLERPKRIRPVDRIRINVHVGTQNSTAERIRLRIPSPPASIPAEDVVVLLLPFPAHRELLTRESERLVGTGSGAHLVDVAEGLVLGLPEDGGVRCCLQDRGAEVVGEGEAWQLGRCELCDRSACGGWRFTTYLAVYPPQNDSECESSG